LARPLDEVRRALEIATPELYRGIMP